MFKVLFHKPNGVLDGYFKQISENELHTILNLLPTNWVATLYDAVTNEIQFSYTNQK